jgi:hypothetical protein
MQRLSLGTPRSEPKRADYGEAWGNSRPEHSRNTEPTPPNSREVAKGLSFGTLQTATAITMGEAKSVQSGIPAYHWG